MKKFLLPVLGVVVGALGGFAYWYFVGCDSGGCAITSSPLNSTVYGSVMGLLLFLSFKNEKPKSN